LIFCENGVNLMNKILKRTLIAFFILSPVIFITITKTFKLYSSSQAKPVKLDIIFDLDGVLVETNKSAIASILKKKVGLFGLMRCAKRLKASPGAQALLYDLLTTIKPHNSSNDLYAHATDHNGDRLPAIMCDWLLGTSKNQDILDLIDNSLENNPELYDTPIFNNKAERKAIRTIIETIFNPELFAETRSFISDGVDFAFKCKQDGHRLFILSNWDKESFEHLYNQYPEFFDIFDDIILSGNIGFIKPDPKAYNFVINKHKLNRKHCVFIDDQEKNVTAAQSPAVGIHAIHCQRPTGLSSYWNNRLDFGAIENQLLALEQLIIFKNSPIYSDTAIVVADQEDQQPTSSTTGQEGHA